MGHVLHCKDTGLECDAVIRGDNEEQTLSKAAEHVRSEHGIREVHEGLMENMRRVLREG